MNANNAKTIPPGNDRDNLREYQQCDGQAPTPQIHPRFKRRKKGSHGHNYSKQASPNQRERHIKEAFQTSQPYHLKMGTMEYEAQYPHRQPVTLENTTRAFKELMRGVQFPRYSRQRQRLGTNPKKDCQRAQKFNKISKGAEIWHQIE